MTACVNKKSKRVAAVVTASLVGALSIGAPAVALATTDAGIDLLAADWFDGAKVSKATDGKGGSVSDPLKATFEAGSGKYLVPTQVANQHVATDVDDDFDIVYKAANTGSSYTGLNNNWKYKSDALGLKTFTYKKDNGLTPEQAAAYFSGKLTGIRGEAITVKADSWTVYVSKDGSTPVTAVFQISAAQAKTYTAFEVNPADASDTSDTTFTYDGTALVTESNRDKNAIQFVDQNGDVLKPDSVTIKTSAGGEVTEKSVKKPGSYVVTFTADDKTYNVPVTVGKLDLSEAKLSIENKLNTNYTNTVKDTAVQDTAVQDTDLLKNIKLGEVSLSDMGGISVTKVSAPNGSSILDTTKGVYTVTVAANSNSDVATGSATVSYAVLDSNTLAEMKVYYGKKEVNGTNGISIDLAAGQSFDASKVSVTYKAEDNKTYTLSGDQLELVFKADDKVVDASELAKAGKYTLVVKAKPFQDFYSSNKWVSGASSEMAISVTGKTVAHNDVAFYFDGEIAGARKAVTYDGTDQLDKLTAKVLDEDGKELVEGTDYTLEVTYKGKKVEKAVDADEQNPYKVTVKPITFTFDGSQTESFDLTIKKVKLDVLIPSTIDMKAAANDETGEIETEGEGNEFYVPFTGKAVSIPALKYEVKDAKGNCTYVDLDSSLYSVVNVKYKNNVVKEAVKADPKNPYTVKVILTDDASKNYSLNDSTFSFTIREYGHFADVDSAEWYSVPVEKAYYELYVNGISGTNLFAPKAEITRADAVCIVFNMAGGDQKIKDDEFSFSEVGGYVTGFSDVDGHAYFAKALAWAKASGVANGSNGQFRPYDKITREEFASLLANFAKSKGDYEAVDADEVLGSATDFSAWAKENVAWAKANKVMGNGGFINGTGNITRAEVASMAVNYQPQNLTGLTRNADGDIIAKPRA